MITLGLDVGSLFTKAVLLKDDLILAATACPTQGSMAGVIEDLIGQVLTAGRVDRKRLDIISATGQGSELVEAADYLEDDVSCIAAASRHHLADVELTLEIGGQSITGVLSSPGGEVVNYMRNDKCASGSGRFIEVICAALGVEVAQLDQTAALSTKKVTVSTQCAVFAESEIISHLNGGEAVPDIISGICESTARVIVSQALRFGPVQHYTVTGGVARFSSITGILAARLPGRCHPFPTDPRFCAAYGAALLGRED